MRSILAAGLILGVVATSPAIAHQAVAGAALPARQSYFPADGDLQALMNALRTQFRARGIALGLLEPDGTRRIVLAGDAGDGARPLSEQTVFEIGSATKTFTGTLLAHAVARGEVKLDDPVAKFLPDSVRFPSKDGRQITLLDLATHRSGLPRIPTGYAPPDPANPYADFDEAALYAWLSSHELTAAPGEKAAYSNLGMGLLGHALARAAGATSFQDLVRERIILPLGMNSTGFGSEGELGAALAQGHDQRGAPVPHWDVAVLGGAGGINSTVGDMLTYLEANAGVPRNDVERAMRAAQAPRQRLEGDYAIGLGWQMLDRDGRRILLHGGGTGGFGTAMAFDPRTGAGAVMLINSADVGPRDDIVLQLLKPRIPDPSGQQAEDYVGTYRFDEKHALTVTRREDGLYVAMTGQPAFRIFATDADQFMLLPVQASLTFEREQTGKVTSVVLHQKGREIKAERIEPAG